MTIDEIKAAYAAIPFPNGKLDADLHVRIIKALSHLPAEVSDDAMSLVEFANSHTRGVSDDRAARIANAFSRIKSVIAETSCEAPDIFADTREASRVNDECGGAISNALIVILSCRMGLGSVLVLKYWMSSHTTDKGLIEQDAALGYPGLRAYYKAWIDSLIAEFTY